MAPWRSQAWTALEAITEAACRAALRRGAANRVAVLGERCTSGDVRSGLVAGSW